MKKYILPIYNRIKKDVVGNRVGISAFVGIFVLFFVLFGDVCLSQILFGFPCPGCGLTRAGVLVLKFQFVRAWQMHPFIYAWLCFVAYICYKRYIRGRKVKGIIPIVIGITLAMFAFYVYRMIHFYPEVEPMIQQDESLYHSAMDFLRKVGVWK